MKCWRYMCVTSALCATLHAAANDTSHLEADYLWLEASESAVTRSWIDAQNARSLQALTSSAVFNELREPLFAVLTDANRIPQVRKLGPHFYNFWRDAHRPRGVWRRTDWKSYARAAPRWQVVLDLDELAAREKENWVWRGVTCLHPEYRRCLVHLSRGGGDAVVIREFDLEAQRFVAEGFQLPEGKSRVAWRDFDHLYVAAAFGADAQTNAGYSRTVREWKRGTPFAESPEIFSGSASDVAVFAFVVDGIDRRREFITRTLSGNEGQTFIREGDRWVRMELPAGVDASLHRDRLLVWLRHPWRAGSKQYPAGSLLAIKLDRFLAGRRDFQMLFVPERGRSLLAYTATRNRILLTIHDGQSSRIVSLWPRMGSWRGRVLATDPGVVSVRAVDEFESDQYWLTQSDFLTPPSLHLGGEDPLGRVIQRVLFRSPHQFQSADLRVTRHTAHSKDGTPIPYFQVGVQHTLPNVARPTLLTGYGGFEVARRPYYDAVIGKAWLERGGIYVVANIRGGGEFGPQWHQAAIGGRRQNAYDDFLAVAKDLVARGVTSPRQLAASGVSNGGLLVAAAVMQSPESFGAAICHAPLLDMRRYHKLAAGASWLAEFGDPDKPEDWAYIERYSPLQNVWPDKHYPPMLFTTSSSDDRVHPAHARKMVALMRDMGHTAFLYESPDGGHTGATDARGLAHLHALTYAFLWAHLQ